MLHEAALRPAGRFIADASWRLPLAAMSRAPADDDLEHCRGRAVLLAMASQMQAASALIQLHGVASRLVLCPPGASSGQIAHIASQAAADIVLAGWRLPEARPPSPNPPAQPAGWRGIKTQWVLLTSGSTGRPKLVVHSLESLAGHMRAPGAATGAVWCSFYDIRRYGGLQVFFRAILQGGSLLLTGHPSQDFEATLITAVQAGATHFVGTPSHWRRVLMSRSFSNLRPAYIRLSGEIADQAILYRLHTAFPAAVIVHAFASTEAGLGFEVADCRAGAPLGLLAGGGLAGCDIRLVDGSLQLRSGRVAAGYLMHGTLCPLTNADGFVDTGDQMAAHGDRLVFKGRRDDMINVGGHKVHPSCVEAVINDHPEVCMSRVWGRSNPITGALVSAEIVCRSGGQANAAALEASIRAFCRTRLAAHEAPATIRIVADLALSPSGKLARLHG